MGKPKGQCIPVLFPQPVSSNSVRPLRMQICRQGIFPDSAIIHDGAAETPTFIIEGSPADCLPRSHAFSLPESSQFLNRTRHRLQPTCFQMLENCCFGEQSTICRAENRCRSQQESLSTATFPFTSPIGHLLITLSHKPCRRLSCRSNAFESPFGSTVSPRP